MKLGRRSSKRNTFLQTQQYFFGEYVIGGGVFGKDGKPLDSCTDIDGFFMGAQ
jgi:hypothetical protein